MAFDENLAVRIREVLEHTKNLVEQRLFGGVAFLLDGNILVGVWKESLFARIGPEHYEAALQEPFVHEFNVTGKAMTGWVLIDPEGIDNDSELRSWIQRAKKFVQQFPAK